MTSTDFKDISIRGRVAFAIHCFEKTLIHLHCDLPKWRPVLETVWTFTDSRDLSKWDGRFGAMLRRAVMMFDRLSERIRFIDEDTFYYLRGLYVGSPPQIDYIMERIFYIGAMHLYSSISGCGTESLQELQDLMDFMEQNELPMPDVEVYRIYAFTEIRGWGARFDGRKLSMILGEPECS